MAIALVDVNNFYASCERLFRPELRGRPIVVLSNNDGCVVSRSPEAKAMGIKMAGPYFKIREQFEAHGGVAFSSNYALYGDMSGRVMSTLETMAPELEVYSIDEAFLSLSESFAGDLTAYGQQIRQRVWQWTGLTVGVGIGPTKTLAKLANYAAKKWPATGGVVDLRDELRRARLMAITPVDEVWGIGRRLGAKLVAQGINTVADLVASDAKGLRAQYGVVVERIVQELRGLPCAELTVEPAAKLQILSSRSFGERVTDRGEMAQALSGFMARAAEKLRAEGMCCQRVHLFVRTSPFDERAPYYSEQAGVRLVCPHVQDLKRRVHLKRLPRSCSVSTFSAWFGRRSWPNNRQPIPIFPLFLSAPYGPLLPIAVATTSHCSSTLSASIAPHSSHSARPVSSSPATAGSSTPTPRQSLSRPSQTP